MANPRSLVYALYTHWDTVEVLVRLSREFAVLTSEQVLGCIAKVAPQLDAEAQGAALRAMVNVDILQPCARSSDLQLNAYVLDFVRVLPSPPSATHPAQRTPGRINALTAPVAFEA